MKINQVVTLNNHAIASIEYRGDVVDVYDLTVEDVHNFIANEICISNSSSPNLQNLPKRNYEVSQIVRQCYTVPPRVPCKPGEAEEVHIFDWKKGMTINKMSDLVEIGLIKRIKVPVKDLTSYPPREYGYRIEYYKVSKPGDWYILECDGSNLQSKIAASMSHDSNLCKLFREGGDFHTNNAYHIMAKNQLFDRCSVTFQSGKVDVQMEYVDCKIQRKGREIHVYYNELENGDVFPDGEIVSSVSKAGEFISYEDYCKNAKKGRCKDLRQIGKMCFAKGTEVLTNHGWYRIEDICRENPFVNMGMFYKGNLKAVGWDGREQNIIATIKNNNPSKVRFDLENGSIIEVTDDHEMPVIRDGKRIIIPARDVLETDEFIDYMNPI
jgi:hypothetical protein